MCSRGSWLVSFALPWWQRMWLTFSPTYLPPVLSSLVRWFLRTWPILIELFSYSWLLRVLFILSISAVSDVLFANILSLSVAISLFLGDVFYRAKSSNLMKSIWSIISFMDSAWGLDFNTLRWESPNFSRKCFPEMIWAFNSESILKFVKLENKGKNIRRQNQG